ncbi:MAG: ABC transporter permease [Myxococcales bacterium]|nr:ABC transporter permease [Myxococcales bacterium]
MLWNAFLLAMSAIRRNGVRSALTALGVVIGVASVILMVDLGQSATRNVTEQISKMGPNLLFVRAGFGRRGAAGTRSAARSLERADAEAISRELRGVTVAPAASTSATVVYGNLNYSTSIVGSTEDYLEVRSRSISRGRSFTEQERSEAAPVCIVGTTVIEELYGTAEPLGTQLRIGRLSCLVIGVLSDKGETMGEDQDAMILTPLATVQRRLLGSDDITDIFVSAASADDTARVKEELESLLRQRRGLGPLDDDDFFVRDMQELASALEGTTSTLTSLLAAIAAVSLVVGGIGIMNIMLVSVTERTREIGVRIAIGALPREVLLQFLVEATVLSVLGGAVGIVLGLVGSYLAASELEMPLVIAWEVVIVAFAVSAAIGMAFGFIPARKAAHLDPIDALRHE